MIINQSAPTVMIFDLLGYRNSWTKVYDGQNHEDFNLSFLNFEYICYYSKFWFPELKTDNVNTYPNRYPQQI